MSRSTMCIRFIHLAKASSRTQGLHVRIFGVAACSPKDNFTQGQEIPYHYARSQLLVRHIRNIVSWGKRNELTFSRKDRQGKAVEMVT